MEHRIFVVGTPRSGTTLVQSMLAGHSGLTSFTESHFFSRHFRQFGSWVVMTSNPAADIQKFLKENNAQRQLDRFSRFRPVSATERFFQLLDDIAQERGKQGWIEKTPRHLNFLPWITKVAPGSKCIHVVRRGIDVVSSLYLASKDWERSYSIRECAERWNREIEISIKRANEDHFVFYEELTRQPQQAMKNLLGQLELPWEAHFEADTHQLQPSLVADNEHWKSKNQRRLTPSTVSATALTSNQRSVALSTLNERAYDQLRERVSV